VSRSAQCYIHDESKGVPIAGFNRGFFFAMESFIHRDHPGVTFVVHEEFPYKNVHLFSTMEAAKKYRLAYMQSSGYWSTVNADRSSVNLMAMKEPAMKDNVVSVLSQFPVSELEVGGITVHQIGEHIPTSFDSQILSTLFSTRGIFVWKSSKKLTDCKFCHLSRIDYVIPGERRGDDNWAPGRDFRSLLEHIDQGYALSVLHFPKTQMSEIIRLATFFRNNRFVVRTALLEPAREVLEMIIKRC